MKLAELLPSHLAERIAEESIESGPGDFVLYWTHSALRVDENPALDSARILAAQLCKPLLVYQGLSSKYRYASDRHHWFILEAARDLQSAYRRLDIPFAFHLEVDRSIQPLRSLIGSACLVVTDDLPTAPFSVFHRSLSRDQRKKVLRVDTACVLPMMVVGRAIPRAYAFRDATQTPRGQRLLSPWPSVSEVNNRQLSEFQSICPTIDLSSANLPELVAACSIDHSIGKVVDTQGGSLAGYARWRDFLASGIGAYAKSRNNAIAFRSVSRMSGYLHYGMVAPTRIAREAKLHKGKGAEKYLDELLIWRELAYCYCKFTRNYASWHCLPTWARETLSNHQTDPRQSLYSWEELARGMTEDPLWNAAQHSLVQHGELHNNLRMTWGKAILNWCKTPRQALKMAVDLNHRYALDGRDPCSYGGILWCFGQFDRPFSPEQPVFGAVRSRSTVDHAKRLDVSEYRRVVVHRRKQREKVLVIGAGISGAMAARTLSAHGLEVLVLEKSRGLGGRMATRRLVHDPSGHLVRPHELKSTQQGHEAASQIFEWDHGAQYFTARSNLFRRYVASWHKQGLVAHWDGHIAVFGKRDFGGIAQSSSTGNVSSGNRDTPKNARQGNPQRFVACPRMPALAEHLLRGIPCRLGVRAGNIESTNTGVTVLGDDGKVLEEADRVIVATVPDQITAMVSSIGGLEGLSDFHLRPCWAAMIELAAPLQLPFVGAFVNAGPISWFAINDSKPQRRKSNTILVHANPNWSEQHLEATAGEVAAKLKDAFLRLLQGDVACDVPFDPQPTEVRNICAHRWRYAIPASAGHPQQFLSSTCHRVLCAGDWLAGARVEGAFLSGLAAAGHVLALQPSVLEAKPAQLELF